MSLALIRGAGDVGTAVGVLLRSLGFRLVYSELPQPTVLRWAVAFAEAVYRGAWEVAGIRARLASSPMGARAIVETGDVAILAPEGQALSLLGPEILIDARMAKWNLGTRIDEAPLVIGLGPGFVAGKDCHAVVETLDGPQLGRVILRGSAAPPTHRPCAVEGYREERVLRAPRDGEFAPARTIGDLVAAGEALGRIAGETLYSPLGGVVRGILHPGLFVRKGAKVAEIDPRGDPAIPFKLSVRSLRIAEGVVQALSLCAPARRP